MHRGIFKKLYPQLVNLLVQCDDFQSNDRLKAIFVDERLIVWQNDLPEANTIAERVKRIIDFLHKKHNSTCGNGLIALLRVLSALTHPDDARHNDLKNMADMLEIDKQTVAAIPEPTPTANPIITSQNDTITPEARLYIERTEDRTVVEAIKKQGVTITIQGSRQMGKTALLMRLMAVANRLEKRFVRLDFGLFTKQSLSDTELFYRQFCVLLSKQLGLADRVDQFWQSPLDNNHRCTNYLEEYLLPTINRPIILAIDKADKLANANFRSDFFGLLRNWHNERTYPTPNNVWRQLDLLLVTSTEPAMLIENDNQSPFNVGQRIQLKNFNEDQISELNIKHGLVLTPTDEKRLFELVNGHPYLSRQAFYMVASRQLSIEQLFELATADNGPFADHLKRLLFRLENHEDLVTGLRQVIAYQTYPDNKVAHRLWSAGLVRYDKKQLLPRCKLYADYFKERLYG